MSGANPLSGVFNLDGLTQALKNIATQIGALNSSLVSVFPQATSTTSTTATSGIETLPGNPAGFLNITINGTPYKVPFYNV